jgi:RNA polymerase sigma-70 factor (ECF subfamily)
VESDEDLMRSWQRGRPQALEVLVVRYHTPIYSYLFRLTGRHALAEDLTQDCFERVVVSRALYDYPRPFRPWLYAVATNAMRRHFESAYVRHTLLVESVEAAGVADAADTPAEVLEFHLRHQEMLDLLADLSPAHRQVILLRYVEDFSLLEIPLAWKPCSGPSSWRGWATGRCALPRTASSGGWASPRPCWGSRAC